MPHTVSAEDKLIWSIPSGATLTCEKSLVMTDGGDIAFTAGKRYKVESMHPIAEPAFVMLVNDQGEPHKLAGGDVDEFFDRKIKAVTP